MVNLPTATTECAFNIKSKNGVCADRETVESMRKFLMNLGHTKEPNKMNEKDIVEKVKKKLSCEVESCIISHPKFVNFIGKTKADKIKKESYKPAGPWDNNEWLSNINIDEVLEQWAKPKKDKDENKKEDCTRFLHIYFQMRDFEIKKTKLATINLANEYEKGMRRFAVVINTDYSDGSGEHWFCIFGDFDRPDGSITLEYFNSSGILPLPEIHDWLYKTKKMLESHLKKNVKIVYVSRNALQKSNSECGVFCLAYIYCRLNGYDYPVFAKPGSLTDEAMYEFRKFLFRSTR